MPISNTITDLSDSEPAPQFLCAGFGCSVHTQITLPDFLFELFAEAGVPCGATSNCQGGSVQTGFPIKSSS